jgi:hypothetical protein
VLLRYLRRSADHYSIRRRRAMATRSNWPSVDGELEFEDEFEGELEFEGEDEGEGFLGNLLGGLLGEGEAEDEFEFEGEDEGEGEEFLGRLVGGLFGEGEGEFEDEFEAEGFVNPQRRLYQDAHQMMEQIGRAASEAESEDEAEAFLPMLLPLAAKALPMLARRVAPRLLRRVAPRLTGLTRNLVRGLRRRRATRPYVRAVPTIVNRTTRRLATYAARGRPVTPAVAQRIFQVEARRVLSNPSVRRRVIRRSMLIQHNYYCGCGRR